jgi:hypothetical protein
MDALFAALAATLTAAIDVVGVDGAIAVVVDPVAAYLSHIGMDLCVGVVAIVAAAFRPQHRVVVVFAALLETDERDVVDVPSRRVHGDRHVDRAMRRYLDRQRVDVEPARGGADAYVDRRIAEVLHGVGHLLQTERAAERTLGHEVVAR